MNVWHPVDRLGYLLSIGWTPHLQVRTGTLLTILGFVLIPYGPFSGEPLLVYEMSALALVLAGLGILVTAVLAVKEDPDSDTEELNPS